MTTETSVNLSDRGYMADTPHEIFAAFDAVGESVALISRGLNVVSCNASFRAKFGYSDDFRHISDVIPGVENSKVKDSIFQSMLYSEQTVRVVFIERLGEWFIMRAKSFAEDLFIVNFASVKASDVKHLISNDIDQVTALSTRNTFEDDLGNALSLGDEFQIVFINISNFKSINEMFGFDRGNEVLMETASRLRSCVRTEKIYRVSGHKFAILFSTKEDISKSVENIYCALKKSFEIDNFALEFRVNILVKHVQDNSFSASEIFSEMERNMEKSIKKNLGISNSEPYKNAQNKLHTMKEIRIALDRERFRMHYQPQVDTTTKVICGAEALIRWECPIKGKTIYPDAFLPLFEEFGMMQELDRYVVNQVFKDIREFKEFGFDFAVSLNLTPATICDVNNTVEFFRLQLLKHRINPSLVTLEITENSLIEDIDRSQIVLQKLKEMGFRIAIDDFGTGYSSLGYLVRYPVNYLKIDREFVTNIDKEVTLQNIVKNLVKMSQSIGISVVAEGAETLAECKVLADLHVDIIQGYAFGKPMKKMAMIERLSKKGFVNK